MTTVQFVALCLAYALAFLRLARVIQPSYKFFPAWAQIALTVAIASVTVFAESLGDDVSRLDVAESVLLAASAGLAAWKGRAALTVAALLLFVSTSASACRPYRLPASDPCSLENPEFIQLVSECDVKISTCPRDVNGHVVESCPALKECEARKAKVCGS